MTKEKGYRKGKVSVSTHSPNTISNLAMRGINLTMNDGPYIWLSSPLPGTIHYAFGIYEGSTIKKSWKNKQSTKLLKRMPYIALPEIGSWLKTIREERGFSVSELGRYLSKKWRIPRYTASDHIHEWQRRQFCSGVRVRADKIKRYTKYLADYVSALCGDDLAESGEVLNSIRRLRPEYGKLESQVPQYQRSYDEVFVRRTARIKRSKLNTKLKKLGNEDLVRVEKVVDGILDTK